MTMGRAVCSKGRSATTRNAGNDKGALLARLSVAPMRIEAPGMEAGE